MKLNSTKFGLATAAAVAIVWIICSLLVWGLPAMMLVMSAHMMHINTLEMAWHLSFTGVLLGLIGWSALAGLSAWLIANLYNRLQ